VVDRCERRRRCQLFTDHVHQCNHHVGRDVGAGPSNAAPTSPSSASTHPRVLEKPPSPSLDQPEYWPLELSDIDASPRRHWGHPCTVHGWGMCPNPVALAATPSVVPMLHRPLTHCTVRKTTESRGRPHGTLGEPRSTTPAISQQGPPMIMLVVPALPPSSEVSPSETRSLPNPLSPSGNRIMWCLTHLASPRCHGCKPGAWSSTTRP
jgi:hypothetical protein